LSVVLVSLVCFAALFGVSHGDGSLIVTYGEQDVFVASYLNGTVLTEVCQGTGFDNTWDVQHIVSWPNPNYEGFYTVAIAVSNSSSVSFYISAVNTQSKLCYDPELICTTHLPRTVGIINVHESNLTHIGYDSNKQELTFTLVLATENGLCYTQTLNYVEDVMTSAALISYSAANDVVSVVDNHGPVALILSTSGRLQSSIDMFVEGFTKVLACKFNDDSEATLTILGQKGQLAQGSVQEVPLSQNWGTSFNVNLPFTFTDGEYQVVLEGFMSYVALESSSSMAYQISLTGNLGLPLASSSALLVPVISLPVE